jgi:hypothetical protein
MNCTGARATRKPIIGERDFTPVSPATSDSEAIAVPIPADALTALNTDGPQETIRDLGESSFPVIHEYTLRAV